MIYKLLVFMLSLFISVYTFAEDPGAPIVSIFDGSQNENYKAERELAEAIINGSSTVSDCYNFDGLFEDSTDIIASLREQFPDLQPQSGGSANPAEGRSSGEN